MLTPTFDAIRDVFQSIDDPAGRKVTVMLRLTTIEALAAEFVGEDGFLWADRRKLYGYPLVKVGENSPEGVLVELEDKSGQLVATADAS